jgi:geranylgeranyl diphosphate synthase type II
MTPILRAAQVKKQLSKYSDLTLQAILSYIPSKEPKRYLYDLVTDYPKRGGKGFRPGLCLATCSAFGGKIEYAIRSAAALELFHNAFLVHDDIEDGSEFRRGDPTLHDAYGVGIAVNTGDAMNVLSIGPLMDNLGPLGSGLTRKIFAEIKHMVTESVEGQAIELGWVRDNIRDLVEDDYLLMILKKTCWYTCIHPCRIGAIIATNGLFDPSRFDRFGFYMGAAFQIQDDILNLVGEESKYGKEIGGDIWEGKRTLMLIHLLNNCTSSEKDFLISFLSKPRLKREFKQVVSVYKLMGRYDSIDYARTVSRQLAGAALHEFYSVFGALPDTEDKDLIQNIVLYMIERDL